MVLVVVVGGLVMYGPTARGFSTDKYVGWPVTIALFALLLVVMVRAMLWSRRRVQELAA
jgi:cyanate permease